MLNYIAPKAVKPLDVAVFARKGCVYCAKAKGLLHDAGIEFEELVLNHDYTDRTLRAVANAMTYPQVFINGEHIGGHEQLEKWLEAKKAA
jgi:glutaredoxin-like protein